MDSKIIDPSSLLVNAEECQRLSYDMLFDDGSYANRDNDENSSEEDSEDREAFQEKIKKLEEKWLQKLEEAQAEAYEQGFEEGKSQAEEEVQQEMEQQLVTLKASLTEIDERIDNLLDDIKPHVVTMVFDVVEKILNLPMKNELLRKRVASEVRAHLRSVEQGVNIKVMVSAKDYGFVVRALKDVPQSENIKITSSEALNTGEYALDTPNERIVKSFKKMLRDFREKIALEENIDLEVES